MVFLNVLMICQNTQKRKCSKKKKTDLVIRFSTVAGELGSADSLREPRGFVVKFYTEEENYDIVGNNTQIFFLRYGMKFPDFIHSQKDIPKLI